MWGRAPPVTCVQSAEAISAEPLLWPLGEDGWSP